MNKTFVCKNKLINMIMILHKKNEKQKGYDKLNFFTFEMNDVGLN